MNFSKYIKTLISVVAFMSLWSCSDDIDPFRSNQSSENGGTKVNILVPDDVLTVLTREEGDENTSDIAISSIVIAQYDDDAGCIGTSTLNVTGDITLNESGEYSFTYVFNEKTITAEFFVNLKGQDALDLSSLTGESQKRAWELSTDKRALWGSANIDRQTSELTVTLHRNYAKLNVASEVSGFKIEEFQIYGNATKGTIGIDVSTDQSDGLTLPTDIAYTAKDVAREGIASDKTIYLFETPKSQNLFVIIKAEYNGKSYFYKAAFATRLYKDSNNPSVSPSNGNYPDETVGNYSYEYVPVKRNHRYLMKVDYVRAEGFDKIEDAISADPDNRISVELVDINTEILDIVACRDYAMGVTGSKLSQKGEASTYTFYVVHNFKLDGEYVVPELKFEYPAEGWFKECKIDEENKSACSGLMEGSVNEEGTATPTGKTAMKYPVVLTFEPNPDDQNARSVEITVKVGDLSRKVTFTQEARDYLRGDDRMVVLFLPDKDGNYEKITNDYFAWIDRRESTDGFCYGVKPEDNRSAVRTNGLIFPPVDLYQGKSVKYYIKGKTDDEITAPSGFTVSQNLISYDGNDYWELTQTNPSAEIGISQNRKLIIRNGNEIINYVIYTTGFFHELTEEMATIQCSSISPKTGWYYYEFVKKGNHYILDRNIGAENNKAYISTDLSYYRNSGAIGGYFQVATARSSALDYADTSTKFWNMKNSSDATVVDILFAKQGVGEFHIPTYNDLSNLSINTYGGSNVASVTGFNAGLVEGARIFLPHGGYYEGNSLKLSTRANIWTGTIYSEPQGFHPNYITYPNTNYGFWYYYLDAQPLAGKAKVFNQIRCTDAVQNNFSDASIFRYMPIRLVWGSCSPITEDSTGERIFLRGEFNEWNPEKAWEFEKISDDLYESQVVTISDGQKFKIAGIDWKGKWNYGGNYTIYPTTIGQPLDPGESSGNLTMQGDFTGTVTFYQEENVWKLTMNPPFDMGRYFTFFVSHTLEWRYVRYGTDKDNLGSYNYLNSPPQPSVSNYREYIMVIDLQMSKLYYQLANATKEKESPVYYVTPNYVKLENGEYYFFMDKDTELKPAE